MPLKLLEKVVDSHIECSHVLLRTSKKTSSISYFSLNIITPIQVT